MKNKVMGIICWGAVFGFLALDVYAKNVSVVRVKQTGLQARQFPGEAIMGRSASLDVLKSVANPGRGELRLSAIPVKPQHGRARIENNKIIYAADMGFFGIERFKYRVSDSRGKSADGDIVLVVKHDLRDGTWFYGNDPRIYSGKPSKQYFRLADRYNSPFGSFGMGHSAPRGYARRKSFSVPGSDFYYTIFGRKMEGGAVSFPAGWTWNIPNSIPNGNFKWAGVRLVGPEYNRTGFSKDNVVEWLFDFEVENYNLGYRRAILINTYWYKEPEGMNAPGGGHKTMDLGVYFTDKEVMKQKMGRGVTKVEVDGRTVYFKPKIRRFFVLVDDFSHFKVEKFDYAPFIRYVSDHGLHKGDAYFWKGAFDVELKHKVHDVPTRKTTGEFLIHDFSYWVHLDLPAKQAIGDRKYKAGSGVHRVDLKNVFQRVGGYAQKWDKSKKKMIYYPAKLTYSVSKNSNRTLVKTEVRGEELLLRAAPGRKGTSTIVVRATDSLNRWFDEETFRVRIEP